ncbi:hypothetical protein [Desertivirga brevis]|uniref:hypothetical protein n=1 Tax=Desertivirga brevis TaxID=2810310 RepID=UPI001A96B931|nr:hypothetical protein [Pedobacter sp. SYSU D00873]
MKKIIYTALMLCLTLLVGTVNAQEQKRSSGNISDQPLWGPVGYNTVSYYFIPDVKAYYSVAEKKFIFLDKGEWVKSETLAEVYKDVDLYSVYKVVINRPEPYLNYKAHVLRYGHYAGQKNKQVAIANSTNSKYFVINGHPKAAEEQASLNNQ